MYYKIVTLDGRFAGVTMWKYRLDFVSPTYRHDPLTNLEIKVDFHQMREWCWEVFGSSAERDNIEHIAYAAKTLPYTTDLSQFAPVWCWHSEMRNLYIYIKDDVHLSHVQLKWLVDGK